MDKAAAINALAQFRKALEDLGINGITLILFGSHAKGNPREDSDIDVVVLSEDFGRMADWDRIKLLSKAICASHVLIEAVGLTPAEWESGESIIAEYARDGEVIAA